MWTKHFADFGGARIPIVAGILVALASGGYANPVGQASTPAGAAFAGACAGNEAFGGLPNGGPGAIYNPTSENFGDGVSYYNCNYNYSNVGGAVSVGATNSGNFSGNPWNNQSNSSAAPEQIHLTGTNNATTLSEFAGATANGGWNDNFTLQITDPSVVLTTPVSGFWVVPINVDGALSVNNDFAVAQFAVGAYENGSEVDFTTGGGSAYNFFTANNTVDNGDIGSSTDLMQVAYGVGGGGNLLNLNVNSTILFALPVTFTSNTATIEGGFYAQLWITQSFGAPATPTTETADFQNTVAWGGPGELVLGGTTYQSNDFSVTGTSGANYEAPFSETPEPATVTFLALGLVILLCWKWREARRRV